MRIVKLEVERYKGYYRRCVLELRPLTLLVGRNSSGKSALARTFSLLAGALCSDTSEPLPLESRGIRHAQSFDDLVSGRSVHGSVVFALEFADGATTLRLEVEVQNIVGSDGQARRRITKWTYRENGRPCIDYVLQGLDEGARYQIKGSHRLTEREETVDWEGLRPNSIPQDIQEEQIHLARFLQNLETWARGVRHLISPRMVESGPFPEPSPPVELGSDGRAAARLLASDEELLRQIVQWYKQTFGVHLRIGREGTYRVLRLRTPRTEVDLQQAGQGLLHVLPVAVQALASRYAGIGIDIVEHPEAELHPGAHASVAELLLAQRSPERPCLVETHSETLLLRARRWVAEGRLAPDELAIYWIDQDSSGDSTLRRIAVTGAGDLDAWPEGVFSEDYEELLAIRRAARKGRRS